jgi:hypothetical protein
LALLPRIISDGDDLSAPLWDDVLGVADRSDRLKLLLKLIVSRFNN